ncbi:MAG TPA: NB-ARC domain-containing protein [Herpetosiphonaceae bacterium]
MREDPEELIPDDIAALAEEVHKLNDFVLRLRDATSLSQQAVADRICIHRTQLAKAESAPDQASLPLILALAVVVIEVAASQDQLEECKLAMLDAVNQILKTFFRGRHAPFRTWERLASMAGQGVARRRAARSKRLQDGVADERGEDGIGQEAAAPAEQEPDAPDAVPLAGETRGSAPPPPPLLVGRAAERAAIKAQLAEQADEIVLPLAVVQGLPGVGKTALVAALAYDPDLHELFADGVLWAELGKQPDLIRLLKDWGRALGLPGSGLPNDARDLSAALAAGARGKKLLILLDDVWEAKDALPFRIGGSGSAMIVATRLPRVADALAAPARYCHSLRPLPFADGLALLEQYIPDVARDHAALCRELAGEIDGLPLGLTVAAQLIHKECRYQDSVVVERILGGLLNLTDLLEAAPPLHLLEADPGFPTVAARFAKSTEGLELVTYDRFIRLGMFAAKPAVFDLAAIEAICDMRPVMPVLIELIEQGLLERGADGSYRLHALLAAYARWLLGHIGASSRYGD